jgi:hypothetical protein
MDHPSLSSNVFFRSICNAIVVIEDERIYIYIYTHTYIYIYICMYIILRAICTSAIT